MGDLFHRNATGILPGQGATHAIAHGEDEIHGLQRGFADPPQVVEFPGIKAQAHEGIFIVRSDLAAIRPTGPAQGGGRDGGG